MFNRPRQRRWSANIFCAFVAGGKRNLHPFHHLSEERLSSRCNTKYSALYPMAMLVGATEMVGDSKNLGESAKGCDEEAVVEAVEFETGETRIQYRLIGVRKVDIGVEIDEDREVGTDIEAAERRRL